MRLAFKERAALTDHPTAKRLFEIMEEKKSNLGLSADLQKSSDLLKLIDKVGSEICLLKTHIDILKDFNSDFINQIQELSLKHNFLIFEDRKFADIGNTVRQQYAEGVYRIADWADITNAHVVMGPGTIVGLKEVGLPKKRGLLLLAEMSSTGSFSYVDTSLNWALDHRDFVMGFICQSQITTDPRFIHITPGIQLQEGKDHLGQNYRTPEMAMAAGSDLILVGRAILSAEDPKGVASLFKERAWNAYYEK